MYLGADTQANLLLSLTAFCGEFPAKELNRLPGSDSYHAQLVWTLKKYGLLKIHERDGCKGYRLTPKSKALLLENTPDRYSFFLSGASDTNHPRTDVVRRLRMHRLGQIYLTLHNTGVIYRPGEKVSLFSPTSMLQPPAFYSSREIKSVGMDTIKIRGSRMMGVITAGDRLLLLYNSGGSLPGWESRAEQRAKILLELMTQRKRKVIGIQYMDSFQSVQPLLSAALSGGKEYFLRDESYDEFYFFTNDTAGEISLRLLLFPTLRKQLDGILAQGLLPPDPKAPADCDALDPQGKPVLFAYLADLPRLRRFLIFLSLHQQTGAIICFDFQAPVFESICGRLAEIQAIDLEQFRRRFFPSSNKKSEINN